MENQLKATELRIGNLINPDNPIMVEAWMLLPESKINFIGIPITEDILVKLGFDKRADWQFVNNKLVIEIWKAVHQKIVVRLRVNENEIIVVRENLFVHQLQNLFFSLCGEELTFKN